MTGMTDKSIARKGLQAGTVGLLGTIVTGVAAVAPFYTSSASLGPAVAAVGTQVPAVILMGAVPMLLAAIGYRELNRAMPDAGTSFTWVASAFGPRMGWVAGWALTVAMALGFSNAAAFAVEFVYVGLAQLFSAPAIAALSQNTVINLLTSLLIIALCGWGAYRGTTTAQAVQTILTNIQVIVLVALLAIVFTSDLGADGAPRQAISLSWFDPLSAMSASGLATGLSLAVFMFWGWETTLTLNEEATEGRSTPGMAAWMTVAATVLVFVLIALACISFAGVSNSRLGLTNPDVQSNVLSALAEPIFGKFALVCWIALLFSSIACVQSTIGCPSRTVLAMGFYGALPAALGRVSRHKTPGAAILVTTLGSWGTYATIRLASQNVLSDTVAALAILACFYLSLTSLACVWYFRKEWFTSTRSLFLRFLLPLLGGLSLAALFVKTIIDSADPTYGSGSRIGSIGLVAVIGLGLILLGVAIMMIMNVINPAYFKGKTMPVAGAPIGGEC
jgi:amino acid transporter